MAASPRDMRAALHRARLRVTRGLRVAYNPRTDGKPDPGEVVWAWVPYEEDASQGKDRPVLLIEMEEAHTKQPIEESLAAVMALGYDGFVLLGGELRNLDAFDPDAHHRKAPTAADYIFNFIFKPRPDKTPGGR